PGEIEAAIAAHPGVAAAAVKLWPAEAVAGSSAAGSSAAGSSAAGSSPAGSSVTGSSAGSTGQARLAAYYTLAEGYALPAATGAATTDAGPLGTVAAHGAAAGPDAATSDVPSAAAQSGIATSRPGTTRLAAMDPSVPQEADQDGDQGARHAHGSTPHGSAPASATGPIPTEPVHAAADPTAPATLYTDTPDTDTTAPAAPLPDLADWIARHLAPAMQPDALILMDALPLTASGKLDRKALPKPQNWGQRAQNRAAPEGQTEQTLAAIWAETLGIDTNEIARDDSFFALGGHSLTAMRTAARIRDRFQTNTTLAQIFDTPILKALAQSIDATAKDTPAPTAEIAPGTLSPAQHRMWFLQTLTPDAAPYNMPAAFDLEGDIDADALGKTLKTLAKTHDILRTIYPTTDGSPRAEITETLPDLIRETLPSRDAARARAKTLAQTPFALTTDIPIRAHLLTYAPNHAILTLTLHHIAADGWAVGLLLEEFASLYAKFRAGAVPTPKHGPSYAAFTAWQAAQAAHPGQDARLKAAAERLEGAPPALALPFDHERPDIQSFNGGKHHFTLPDPLITALRARAQAKGQTLFVQLMAGLNAMLGRITGEADLLIGTPVARRDLPQTEGLIGSVMNTVAVRTALTEDMTLDQVASAVQRGLRDAIAEQDIPFERIIDALHVERSLSHAPLFQVLFAMQDDALDRFELTGAQTKLLPQTTPAAKFDLTLTVDDSTADSLDAAFEYAADLFEPETIAVLTRAYLEVLTQLAQQGRTPLAEVTTGEMPARALVRSETAPPVDQEPQIAGNAPQGELEETLANIWQGLLNLDEVSRDVSFFALGGHSLNANQMVARFEHATGLTLSMRDVFLTPTIAELAAKATAAPPPDQPTVDRSQPIPLTPAQLDIYLACQKAPNSLAYLIPAAYRVTGPFNLDRFEAACRAVIDAHEILRVAIVDTAEAPAQIIEKSPSFQINRLTAPTEEDATAWALNALRQPLPLDQAPLFRITAIEDGAGTVLAFSFHHLIFDGWSLSLFVQELFARYHDQPRPADPVQFFDIPMPVADAESAAFWSAHLTPVPEKLLLPYDGSASGDEAAWQTAHLTLNEIKALKSYAKNHGISPFILSLSALQILLSRQANQHDITIGIATSGRESAAKQASFGLFLNTIPFRAQVRENDSLADLLTRNRDAFSAAMTHTQYPLSHMIADLGAADGPLFDVLIDWQDERLTDARLDVAAGALEVVDLRLSPTGAKAPLTFYLRDRAEGLEVSLEHNASLLSSSTASSLLSQFIEGLRGVVGGVGCV
ncbi:non-ribosomal peptide synthetase component F, partial [Rubricella aquisinus]